MTLQADAAVPVWGRAAAGEDAGFAIAGQTKSVKADDKSEWRVKLNPLKSGNSTKMKTWTPQRAKEVYARQLESWQNWPIRQRRRTSPRRRNRLRVLILARELRETSSTAESLRWSVPGSKVRSGIKASRTPSPSTMATFTPNNSRYSSKTGASLGRRAMSPESHRHLAGGENTRRRAPRLERRSEGELRERCGTARLAIPQGCVVNSILLGRRMRQRNQIILLSNLILLVELSTLSP